jgi:hypothetical protein
MRGRFSRRELSQLPAAAVRNVTGPGLILSG